MDEHENWFENQNNILQIITSECRRRFKKDTYASIQQTAPLLKDICDDDDRWLIQETIDEDISQVVNQINHLKY